jgi:hypothetical protein
VRNAGRRGARAASGLKERAAARIRTACRTNVIGDSELRRKALRSARCRTRATFEPYARAAERELIRRQLVLGRPLLNMEAETQGPQLPLL